MAHMAFVILVLLSSSTLGNPLFFGWFDEDDDDQPAVMVNGTLANTSSTSMPTFNCQALDDVFSYFNDLYEYLDQTFNPFYESPLSTTPMPPPDVNITQVNSTITNSTTIKA